MSIITWIVPGLGVGLLASMLTLRRSSQGLVTTGVTGVAGARPGGRAHR